MASHNKTAYVSLVAASSLTSDAPARNLPGYVFKLPFGEEIFAGVGGRSESQGYVADSVRQQFTAYERDDETGLDYAQARYFASAMGRFISVDPENAGADLIDPQSWNGYGYSLNNPVNIIDPDGLDPSTHTDRNGIVIAVINDDNLGVYRHNDIDDNKRNETFPFSGKDAVERVGETEYWDEFAWHAYETGLTVPIGDPGGNTRTGYVKIAEKARIMFGQSFDDTIYNLNIWAVRNHNLADIAEMSRNGNSLDIKVDKTIAPYGPNTGKLLNGKYATARSAGNFFAGLNGATATYLDNFISETTMIRLSGLLNQKKFSVFNAMQVLTMNVAWGTAPWYGEIEYTGRRVKAGFQVGERLRNSSIYRR